MNAHIVDNERRELADVLNQLAPGFSHISIATGYWDLPGMGVVLDALEKFESIRLLIGQEPLAPRHARALNINSPELTFPELEFRESLENLPNSDAFRDLVVRTKKAIDAGQLDVRVYRRAFLHAKTYIFGTYDTPQAVGIIGSSNFTHAGLTRNIELNAIEHDERIVQHIPNNPAGEYGHLSWFDSKWNDPETELWSGAFSAILSNSPVGDMAFSPFMMYIRTLYELYEEELVEDDSLTEEVSEVLFDFQQRNAKLLLRKLEKNGLAMLADSVGLGKTITAGAVIKHFIQEKDAKRIYVIAPASLTAQWKEDLAKVHNLFSGFEVLSMQDMNKIQRARDIDVYANVDLFVVDEAHNLRNDASVRHQELLEWFSENPDSNVLLLTATPINNSLTDFVNQIQLAAKGKLESFPVVYPTSKKTEVIDFFEAVERLSREIKIAEKANEKPDFAKVNRVMRQGLRHFLVRSTRTGIEREYGGLKDSSGKSLAFPSSKVEVTPYAFTHDLGVRIREIVDAHISDFGGIDPMALSVESLLEQTQRTQHPLDALSTVALKSANGSDSPFEAIFQVLLLLGFSPYKPDTYAHRFYGKSVEEIRAFKLDPAESFRINSQISVHNMLRVTFLKRLESSQFALSRSLHNYSSRLEGFAQRLEQGFVVRPGDLQEVLGKYGDDMELFVSDDSDPKPIAVPADPNVFDVDQMKSDLDKDRAIIKVLLELCEVLESKDDKLAAFSKLLQDLSVSAAGERHKVLIFSYYTDTIEYLRQKLPDHLKINAFDERVAFTSGRTKAQIEDLAKRFSPISKGARPDSGPQIDFLFSTDVLSEGQNLQDCGTLVNFDLHWNPVRMIQRNGRINRLGSTFEQVAIFNMHPDINLEAYLKLVNRLEQKIDRIRYTVGTDQSVLGETANPIEFIDDVEETATVTDATIGLYNPELASDVLRSLDDDDIFLSEDEFIYDLRAFHRDATPDERAELESISIGKWGYLPKLQRSNESNRRSLALVRMSGNSGVDVEPFSSEMFVEITDTYQAIDTVEALQVLRTTRDENDRLMDLMQVDRVAVAKRVVAVARMHAKKGPVFFKVTPTITRVLEALQGSLPDINLRQGLSRIQTKQEKKKARRIFSTANKELKQSRQLLPSTILELQALAHRLASAKVEEAQFDSFRGILFYGK